MIKIIHAEINRFRSIMSLELDFENDYNLVTICGKNNVGKTNVLRAINIFFNPDDYEPQTDMPVFKVATGGTTTHPKIVIQFLDDVSSTIYSIEKIGKNGMQKKFQSLEKNESVLKRNGQN